MLNRFAQHAIACVLCELLCLELFNVFFQHENRFRYKFFDIVQFSRSCAPQPCGWRLDYFTTEAVFCQALFWEAFEILWTWSASCFSVSAGTFQRLLVLFKGFLLSFQKSFFCLSAWRSHIVPYRNHFCKPFLHFFRLFLRFVNYRQFSAGNRRVFWRLRQRRCLPPYIITLYRQRDAQTGIDSGLYYPPESVLRCQDFPCKILSRKISAIFGDCYKTQNIVVFCLTCH